MKRKIPELRFNTSIYKKEAIRRAISDFSNLAEFNLSYNKKYAILKISGIESKFKDVLPYEFSNYVLGLTKECL